MSREEEGGLYRISREEGGGGLYRISREEGGAIQVDIRGGGGKWQTDLYFIFYIWLMNFNRGWAGLGGGVCAGGGGGGLEQHKPDSRITV